MCRPRCSSLLLAFLASCALFFSSAQELRAQTETWQPATSGFSTEINIWTANGNAYAKVRLTFPTGGWRVDWGQVTRAGNNFTADAKVERWDGITTQAITSQENTYHLGTLAAGTYTFTFKSYGVEIRSQQFEPALMAEHWEQATLSSSRVGVRIWGLNSGLTMTKIELYFPDTGYRVADWGQVLRNGNEFSVDVKAERWTGDSQARTTLVDHDYELGALQPGSYSLLVKMYGAIVRTQAFSVQASSVSAPTLLTEDNSERAIALDSVTWLRLFPLATVNNFSPDNRARIVLFLSNVQWPTPETRPAVTAQAEDPQGMTHALTVEYVGKVPNFDWLTQVIVKPPLALQDGGDVWVRVSVGGVLSNRALVGIEASGR
jgi:hypothetical protein